MTSLAFPLGSVGRPTLLKGQDWIIGEFVLGPGEDKIIQCSLPTGATNDLQWANFHAEEARPRGEPVLSMSLVGEIRYVDELGIPRFTGINRTYEPKTKWFRPSGAEGE